MICAITSKKNQSPWSNSMTSKCLVVSRYQSMPFGAPPCFGPGS